MAALGRYSALFLMLGVQLGAIAVVENLPALSVEAGLPPPSAPVAATTSSADRTGRVAPFARGERLLVAMIVAATEPATETTTEAATLANPASAPAPMPEATPEPTPEPAPEPTPAPAPRPTPAPRTAPPAPPPAAIVPDIQAAELRMLALMNASRAQAGLTALALDAGVSATARQHSAVEAQYRYVYHDGPDGTAQSRNVPACGTGWYGENTGKVWGGGVDVLHREFMAEPWQPINHRTNIMEPLFRRAGIGAVQGPDALYITVVFCR